MNSTMIAMLMGVATGSALACAAPGEVTEASESQQLPELGTLRAALGVERPAAGRGDGDTGEDSAGRDGRRRGGAALQMAFADCSEVASLGTIPFAGARGVVPEGFTITGNGTSAIAVVRVAHCRAVQLDHSRPRPATVAQVGVNLSGADGGPGPDTSADINNYTVFFATDDALLARGLRRLGIDAAYDPLLRYALDDVVEPEQLTLAVHRPHEGRYRARSSVVPPVADAVTYVASWWAEGGRGTAQMRTVFPSIRFGSSELELRATPGSDFARLLGTPEPSFDLFDSFNSFDSAEMSVTLSDDGGTP